MQRQQTLFAIIVGVIVLLLGAVFEYRYFFPHHVNARPPNLDFTAFGSATNPATPQGIRQTQMAEFAALRNAVRFAKNQQEFEAASAAFRQWINTHPHYPEPETAAP